MVAKELRSGQTWRLWRGEFGPAPPFPIGPDALFVAYYASAELGCFRALGWPMPANILDLFTEFRDRTNGLTTPAGSGLVGALTYFGLDSVGASEKDEMRARILRGACSERDEEILDYCATDTDALERLLPAMLPRHRSPARPTARTIYGRGRRHGVQRRADRHRHLGALAEALDRYTRRSDRAPLTPITAYLMAAHLSAIGLNPYLIQHGIPWPRSGKRPAGFERDTFRRDGEELSQRSRRCTNCVTPCPNCALMILPLGRDGSQSHYPVGVSSKDRAQSTKQHQIHLWAKCLAARIDQATTRSRRRLCRLVEPRIRNRRQAVRR